MDKIDAIVTLLTEQERRLINKIDAVHSDVKTQNSRVSKLETRASLTELNQENMNINCAAQMNDTSVKLLKIDEYKSVMKIITWIGKNTKATIILFMITFISIDALIHLALDNGWLKQIVQFIESIL